MKNTEKQIFTKIWAPTLVSFTHWVLEELRNRKISKVYFLARDGYMSYLIAREMIERNNLPIECRLLHCSRYAFRMAEYHLLDSEIFDKICIGGISVTLRTILKRGGLTEGEQEEIYGLLKKQGNISEELDTPLTYSRVIWMKELLKECTKLREYIIIHSKDAYEHTMKYLEQEGLMSDMPFAIADSEGVGSMQKTLTNLLTSRGHELTNPIEGFYFGLYELPKGVDAGTYHTFYFRPYKDIRRKVFFSNCLFEAVVSAPEGMTIGYGMGEETEPMGVIPIRESDRNLNFNRVSENIHLLEELLKEDYFLEEILSVKEIARLLSGLMGKPGKEEAECFGSYLFSDDVLSTKVQRLSEDLTEEDIKNLGAINRYLLMKGIRKGELKDTAWPEGSIVLKGKHISWNLYRLRGYKYLIYIRKNCRRLKG